MIEPVWNYSFSVPCALIMVVLLCFYFGMPRIPIRLNRTFIELLGFQLLTMVFDVASSMADQHYQAFSIETLYLLNTLFFVFFLARIYWFFRFTLDILHLNNRVHRLIWFLPIAIVEVMSIFSFKTGAIFTFENGIYRSGPFYNLLYVCFFTYLIASIVLLVANMNKLTRRELICALSFNLVLVVGNIARIQFPKLLVMNTFCMIAILIIYLAFLNPDLYLANRRSAFNLAGFRIVLTERAKRKDCWVLGFAIKNYDYERGVLGGHRMDQVIALIEEYAAQVTPGALVFYFRAGRFAIMGTEGTDWKDAERSLRKRFGEPWQTDTIAFSLNACYAYASTRVGDYTSEQLATNLLIALDEARNSGFEDDREADETRVQMVDSRVNVMRALEQAIEQNSVEVFLQPIVDSEKRQPIAAEALARIRDTNGQILAPAQFIPIAEHTGQITVLGEQILDKTCMFIKEHDLEAMGLNWINVNLSPMQCKQQNVAERFADILAKHGVDPRFIHFEITEQSMIDYSRLEQQAVALNERGFQLALDDYGSGYSNLTRVMHYPFSNIKLDMDVVWEYAREHESLLPAIVQGFKQMGLSVTAEGIETEEIANELTALGADYLQGYLFSKPLPASEFAQKYAQ